MKFQADENFSRPALLALRNAGHDIRSVAEESPGLPDEQVAELCERDQRVLLTFDKDFGELVFRRGLRAGSPAEVLSIFSSLMETGILVEGVFCVANRERIRARQLRQRPDS